MLEDGDDGFGNLNDSDDHSNEGNSEVPDNDWAPPSESDVD